MVASTTIPLISSFTNGTTTNGTATNGTATNKPEEEPEVTSGVIVKEEEHTIQEPEALKCFTFYDTDTGITYEIVEGQEAIIPTWKLKNKGKWTINYVPPSAYFSLDYGLWSSFYLGRWLPSFSNKKMPIKPDSVITSDEVLAGAIQTHTPSSITQAIFAGSSGLKYTAIALLGGVILGLLLRSRKII